MTTKGAPQAERERLAARAEAVTVTRDDWGIAHIHGRTDADAVFGMIYAQAEDDFGRIETNYLTALGRTAEAGDGETAIWSDLRARLFVDPADLRLKYAAAPSWLRALMGAWADGLNHFLLSRPDVRTRVIRRFEPWMALSFTEGANGGDLAKISLADLAVFYGGLDAERMSVAAATGRSSEEPAGSNGIALGPSMTRDGHALLLINPHTAFYLRSELQMSSDEGLNAYGAVTWGQFFVYQGFNAHAGWMHATSSADCVDEFEETIVERAGRLFYRHGAELRPVRTTPVELRFRAQDGTLAARSFTVFRTHHGPIVRAEDGKWVAVALMDRPVAALEQAFLRTKAHDLATFTEVSRRAANSTNNTIFADDQGAIAFLNPQFVPRRDDRFDRTRPVDGADPATDWRGDTPIGELPTVIDPPNGWVYNANDGPWWAAGQYSPRRGDYPGYMDRVGANCRTAHALEILEAWQGFTLERLRDAAYDSHLHVFAKLLPDLLTAFDVLAVSDVRRANLAEPIAALRDWDCRSSLDSVGTTLAVSWGETMRERVAPELRPGRLSVVDRIARTSADQKLTALADAVGALLRDFGRCDVAWGELNRFQRIDARATPRFDDAEPSWPVPFAASQWGALTAYAAARHPGTTKIYGTSGNSFIAVVEFGPRVRALALSAGGASGDPGSPHFADQAERFASGDLRPVYFHPDELAGHVERTYQPGRAEPR
ncbi:penicillin acylase family protein [Phenylobacterium sp.]|jgi:acyl-homoserine-lactone acylase|uniref:penicillin acylase family protein n=1 Tax=Phenylobacterium sp. TaxID=1871053 RepID=UPI002E3721C3|nr:penicillin acylase family protein [Phenylobacterium sp.]HEX3364082.1 penicillin acylase family protein [Phenylobacterium sp.]